MNRDFSEKLFQQRLAQIEQNLRSEALNQRIAALDELAVLAPEVAIPILENLAHEQEFTFRRLAVMGLGNHRTEQSFRALQAILERDQDGNVLAEAANSLFEFGDVAIPVLHDLFNRSDNWLVRQTVISLLVETSHYDVLLSVAKASLKQDQEQAVREAGILALSHVLRSPLQDQAMDLLTQLADDSDWRTRWRTAIALQGSQSPQAKQLIAKLQQDDHFRVVAAALEVAAHWQK